MKKKISYEEGDWFAVPLNQGGYSLGRISRIGSRGGVLLGFFFKGCYQTLPLLDAYASLTPDDAILICHFCDPGLRNLTWPVLTKPLLWNRADWSWTDFGHIDALDPNQAFRRTYDDNDPFTMISQLQITPFAAKLLPKDGLGGHIFIQNRLSKLVVTE